MLQILKIRIGMKAIDCLGFSEVGLDNLSYMLGKEECHYCRRYWYRLYMTPIRVVYKEEEKEKRVTFWACNESHAVKAMMFYHPKIYDLKKGVIR